MDAFWQDIRFSWRLTRRRPMVSIVAALSLVVGMSLSLVVFTLLNAVTLRPLPVHAPEELAVVLEQRQTSVNHQMSYPDFVDHRASQQTFVDMLATSPLQVNVRVGSHSQLVLAELVSGSYFSTLGVPTASGRPIQELDEQSGAPPVAVVSERAWRAWGREVPLVPGQSVSLNSVEFSVVGLTRPGFTGAQIGSQTEIWIPISHQPAFSRPPGRSDLSERGASWLTVMGRLRPGMSLEAATADVNRIEAGLFALSGYSEPRTLFASPGARGDASFPPATEATLNSLLIAALLVLLVACANVANLLMARAADRGREMSMRAALGAGSFRLLRMLFLEALLIGGGSAVVSLLVSYLGSGAAASYLTRFGQPLSLDMSLDWRIAVFVVALGLMATVLSSLAPAAHVLNVTGIGALSDRSRSVTAGRLSSRVRTGLLVGQFALSLALVVSALLLGRSVINLRQAPTGFATDEVALLAASPSAAQYSGPRAYTYLTDALARLQREPGVVAASFARVPPINSGGSRGTVMVPGYQPASGEDMEINFNDVTEDYFTSMGITLLDGQLPAADGSGAIVVNATMALRYWPGMRAVGQRLHFGNSTEGPVAEVAGVVADAKYRTMREEPRPSFYRLMGPGVVRDGTFHVRVKGDPSAALPALRNALADVDAAVPISNTRSLTSQLNTNITDDRMAMAIGMALALAALILAGVGLFGAMSHMVGQRTREIGVRMALGATTSGIHRLVLGQALAIAVAGSGIGLALAAWATSFMASRLFGVGQFDPLSFVAAAVVLATVAIASALRPARLAARVDPVFALRQE